MIPATPSIRRATVGDLPAINSLIQASSTYFGEYRPMIATYVADAAQLARDEMYVADGGGAVIGLYSLTLGCEPELDLMFVADGLQRSGLGGALIAHLKRTARRLGVREIKIVSHPPSLGFYKRMGAVETGVKPPSGRVTWARPILMLGCRD